MPRFAANLTLLFNELPFIQRFEAAAAAGFEGVEILRPEVAPADEIRSALNASGLTLALINMPVNDWEKGGRGVAAVPGQQQKFREEFLRACDLAAKLNAERIHIMDGIADGAEAALTHADNLSWAAEAGQDFQLTLEVINRYDMPGYFLHDFNQARRILTNVGVRNLGFQFDAYHAFRISGDIAAMWNKVGSMTVHVQVAGVPERNEPHAGVFDFSEFFADLDRSGYEGWVGAEYHPTGNTFEGLSWLKH